MLLMLMQADAGPKLRDSGVCFSELFFSVVEVLRRFMLSVINVNFGKKKRLGILTKRVGKFLGLKSTYEASGLTQTFFSFEAGYSHGGEL